MSELDAIYRLRTVAEESIRATFEAIPIAAVTRQNAPEKFQKARPRVEIKIAIGGATGRRHLCPDGFTRFDAFNFQLGIQAITAPNPIPTENVLHEDFCARVRNVCSTIGGTANAQDVAHFPDYYIAEAIRETGAPNTLKTEDGVEYTTLGYSGILCIRRTSWPTN